MMSLGFVGRTLGPDRIKLTDIPNGLITGVKINASAAIAGSKLSLTDHITNAMINSAAAIAYSKLNLTGEIVNADVNASAAIAASKLNISKLDFVQINVASKATATTGTWEDVDCSGEIPAGAVAAVGFFKYTNATAFHAGGVRKNGASDEGTYYEASERSVVFFVVELDAGRIFEQKIDNAAADCWITGYFI